MLLRCLWALLYDLFWVTLYPVLWWRRSRPCPRGAWLRIELDGALPEITPPPPWWARSAPHSLEELRRLASMTIADPRVAGWLVEVRSFAGGAVSATALRRVLATVRAGGKRVVVYLPNGGGTRVTAIASAADRVLVGPHSHLAPLGFAVESHYLAEALDRIGVEPEVLARGRYKSAGERLVSRSMSEPQREQLTALLEVAHDELITALAEGRGVSREQAERWVDEGPFPARAAVAAGLADAEAYGDELPERLDPRGTGPATMLGARKYARRRGRALLAPWARPHVAVLELAGPIVQSAPWAALPVATDAAFARAVERVREERAARGVILLVSSPGGSVLASDRMLHELRRLAATKPVVACLGDVAASGGYLVALGAHSIVAEDATITGSIGVVAVRMAFSALLARLGISVQVVKRGERADLGSPSRRLTDGERVALERELADVYDDFVGEVARARGLPLEAILPHAEGRVHSGRAARSLGLVDHLGGFPRAVAEVRQRLGPGGERLPVRAATRDRLPWTIPRPGALGVLGRWAAASELAPALAVGGERTWLWCAVDLVDTGQR